MTAITVQDLDNAQLDAVTLAEVANSRVCGVGTGTPINEATTRLGSSINTVQGQLAKLGFQIPAIDWAESTSITSNIQVYRFPAVIGDFYVAKIPVPFTTGLNFDASNWQPLIVATADNIVDTFPGNGILTEFVLSETPAGVDNMQVFVDALFHSPSLYTLLEYKVTFVTPPPSGISDNVVIITSKNVTVSESSAAASAAEAEASAAEAEASAAEAEADAIQTGSDLAAVTALLGATGTGAIIDFGDRITGTAIFDYGFRV